MKTFKNRQGFTLIELLLVIGIVAIILAVIVPMGLRARIDSQYGVVRQNCSELASFTSQWAEKAILAQDERRSTATIKDYYASLTGAANSGAVDGDNGGQWVAEQTAATNWGIQQNDFVSTNRIAIQGRYMEGLENQIPEDTVEEVIPPDKTIRNPFNQVSVFRSPSDPGFDPPGVKTGAIAFGGKNELDIADGTPWLYFGFVFQGTDSVSDDITNPDGTTFHAGMGLNNIRNLRNGIFAGRFR